MNMITKILMTADTVGGIWTYAIELCRAIRPYGIQVALATMAIAGTERPGSAAMSTAWS